MKKKAAITDNTGRGNNRLPVIMGLAHILLGSFGLLVVINLSAIIEERTSSSAGTIITLSGMAITLPMIAGGAGMLMRRNRGRIAALAASWLAIAAASIYLLLLTAAFIFGTGFFMESDVTEFAMSIASVALASVFPVVSVIVLRQEKFIKTLK